MTRDTKTHATPASRAAASTRNVVQDAWAAPLVMQKASQEAMRFWVLRLQAYADFAESASKSQSPTEWWDAYQTWMSGMRSDYKTEAQNFSEMIAQKPDNSDAHP